MAETRLLVTRRYLLRNAAFAGLGLAAAACVATPSASPQPTTAPPPPTSAPAKPAAAPTSVAAPPTAAPAAKPTTAPAAAATTAPSAGGIKRGSILSIGKFSTVPAGGLDIHQLSTSGVRDIGGLVYETLLKFDPAKTELTYANLVPGLAKSWASSPDGKTYTFELFDGVKWHDGMPVTAADVQFSIDRIRKPPSGQPSPRQGLFSKVVSVEARSNNTVVITLSDVVQSMLENLASPFTAIVPKHVVEREGSLQNVMVGSGPYKLKSFRPQESAELVRNPDYHFADYPYLDGVTLLQIPEFSTMLTAFYSGKIQMTDNGTTLDEGQATIIRNDRPGTTLVRIQTNKYRYLGLSVKSKPFDDIRVRQAVNEAIDRQELMDAQSDKGVLAKGYFPMTNPEWLLPDAELQKLPGFGTDMEARRANARRLLTEAGYGDGLDITLTGRSDLGYSKQLVEVLPAQLAKVGIRAQTRLMEKSAYDPLETSGDIPFRAINDSLRGLDPDAVLILNFAKGAGRNYEAYSDPNVETLLQQQSVTLDAAKRRELVLEIQRQVLLSSHRIPLWWPNAYVAVSPQLKDYLPQALEDTAQLQMERVWLA